MYIALVENYRMNINYIAELKLPSKSAYAIHVMKICEAFKFKYRNLNLYIFKKNKHINIFKKYNIKNKFNIIDFNLNNFNFLNRVIFSIKILKLKNSIKDIKSNIIISRSIIGALFMAFFKYKVILELHHELYGLTKYIFEISKRFNFFKKIKFIFITKNLSKKFKLTNDYIILDDAISLKDFKEKKSQKKKKSCVYTGSLAKGKGLENIFEISKYNKKIYYDIYGDFANSNFNKTSFKDFKNVNYKGYVEYRKIPKILSKYKVALMPYSKKVYVRAKNVETSKYMSPLKLFDYMASKNIIIASKMQVYSHLLNKKNSIIINNNSAKFWSKKIEYALKNYKKLDNLKENAYKKVKNYTWEKRVTEIIKFVND